MWNQFLEQTKGIVRIKNSDTVNKIPARSIVRIMSSAVDSNGIPYFLVEKPASSTLTSSVYLIVNEIDVAADSYGHAYLTHLPSIVSYDSSATAPVAGDTVGPVDGQYYVSTDGSQFQVTEVNSTLGTCRVVNLGSSNKSQVARTTSEHCKGDTQPVEIMTGTKGSETGSGNFVDAYNRFMSLSSDAIVIILFVGNGYEIIAADCNDAANASSCSASGRV